MCVCACMSWFWRVGSVARGFYGLEASPEGSSLERLLRYRIKKCGCACVSA
jgi:hypothetical protein